MLAWFCMVYWLVACGVGRPRTRFPVGPMEDLRWHHHHHIDVPPAHSSTSVHPPITALVILQLLPPTPPITVILRFPICLLTSSLLTSFSHFNQHFVDVPHFFTCHTSHTRVIYRYTLSVARKLGCGVFLVWEDIVAGKPRMMLMLLASLMVVHRRMTRGGGTVQCGGTGAGGTVGSSTVAGGTGVVVWSTGGAPYSEPGGAVHMGGSTAV